jgi:hypothetical protein
MTTGRSPSIPNAVRWTSASCTKASVMTTAVGSPLFSRRTLSCRLHDVQDPQSPIAVSTTSLLAAISLISSGRANLEKLSFR